ncbi:hypothetical protein Tco_1164781 [Tanacetum coccineum]
MKVIWCLRLLQQWKKILMKHIGHYQEAVDCELRKRLGESCKWLFKIKEGIEGVQKPRYKARVVAHGFTQRADDMLIACKSKAEIGSTKSLLKKEFDMKELGEAKKILLSLKDCPVRDCDVERMSKVPYANAVGSLMYLMVCTRPDIAYAVSVVSRYLANPGFVDSDYAKDPDKEAEYMALTEACEGSLFG